MTDQLLSDVKVLDLTHYIAGPYCTKLLADYGADLIKIERPGKGDPARQIGPFLGDDPHPEKSALFLHLNTNKRSLTLNLKSRRGVMIFKELAHQVDIVVENFRPGVMDDFGLSYEELEKINPTLVMTSISNFGQTGPYRDFPASEIVLYGMGGSMLSSGLPDREPVKLARNVGQYQTGVMAAVATMTAFYGANYRGIGQHIDMAIFETQSGSIDRRQTALVNYAYTGYTS
ncbi:MAG: CoA transferase, partial [Candidatus Tectomicrobia bacterium]|nr:CoA transferase [Candidatus Tectomicrobia bacterium]